MLHVTCPLIHSFIPARTMQRRNHLVGYAHLGLCGCFRRDGEGVYPIHQVTYRLVHHLVPLQALGPFKRRGDDMDLKAVSTTLQWLDTDSASPVFGHECPFQTLLEFLLHIYVYVEEKVRGLPGGRLQTRISFFFFFREHEFERIRPRSRSIRTIFCVRSVIYSSAMSTRVGVGRVAPCTSPCATQRAARTQPWVNVRFNIPSSVRSSVRSINAGASSPVSSSHLSSLTVSDIMTSGDIITCSPDTSLDAALELIVANEITGLPVVDEGKRVVGIVSDFDLLALDGVSESEKTELFPSTGDDWGSFFAVQGYVEKNKGSLVSDVMTSSPITVSADSSVSAAAHLLLHKRIRRLPVLDSEGVLIGIISRSNIIKAAWQARKSV